MLHTKFVGKIKTHTFYVQQPFPRKLCRLWDSMEKCVSGEQITDDNVIRRMRFACWITKATNTHSEYIIFLFHSNNIYANTPQCYVYTYIDCPVWFSLLVTLYLIIFTSVNVRREYSDVIVFDLRSYFFSWMFLLSTPQKFLNFKPLAASILPAFGAICLTTH